MICLRSDSSELSWERYDHVESSAGMSYMQTGLTCQSTELLLNWEL